MKSPEFENKWSAHHIAIKLCLISVLSGIVFFGIKWFVSSKNIEVTDEARADNEDYKDDHDPNYKWIVDQQEVLPSPDGIHVATTQHGHIYPYMVAPPFFTKVLVGRLSNDLSEHKIVFGVWDSRSFPNVSWIDDTHLQVTLEFPMGFYRCRRRVDVVSISHILSKSLAPENYRKALDRRLQERIDQLLNSTYGNMHPQWVEQNSDKLRQSTEREWGYYHSFMSSAQKDSESKIGCFSTPLMDR